MTLSRGTPHRAPPRTRAGQPLSEAAAGAAYLVRGGAPAADVLLEELSLDTLGNALFARLLHAEPRNWRRLHIVTSSFHMPRTGLF